MRQEISYEPAVSAPAMRWVEVEVDPDLWPSPRAFHAACAVHLPDVRRPCLLSNNVINVSFRFVLFALLTTAGHSGHHS